MTPRLIPALLCAALAPAACQRVPDADRDAALETVRRNVRSLQEKKIDEMMETIHPRSPAFAGTRAEIANLLRDFDLRCELAAIEVIGSRGGELRVRFEQLTERIKDGNAEPKTRLTGIHVLKKDGAVWKIFDTEIISAEVIDPLPTEQEPADEKGTAP